MAEKIPIPSTNDALAEVECKRMPKCCENPHWVTQFGTDYCFCMNCKKRCSSCHTGDYLKKD
jgi:hypothetical protein